RHPSGGRAREGERLAFLQGIPEGADPDPYGPTALCGGSVATLLLDRPGRPALASARSGARLSLRARQTCDASRPGRPGTRVATWELSNGMLLREDRVRTIVREGLITTHGFSVDGFRASTVESLRVNAKLDTVLEKIRMVLRVRAEERKREPRTIIRYALMRSNVEELPDAIARWGDMGIDRMDCGYLAVCNGIDPQESLYFHQDLMSRAFAEARRAAA